MRRDFAYRLAGTYLAKQSLGSSRAIFSFGDQHEQIRCIGECLATINRVDVPRHERDGLPRPRARFEGENVGLSRAGGQGPDLHVPFRNGARHAKLQVGRECIMSDAVRLLLLAVS